jgi:CheY-like chemotaxis protein
MDFTQTKKILLEKSSDTLAIHQLLKESLGTNSVDILYYDKEKSIYFDKVNDISIQKKYLNNFSILGSALENNKSCFCVDFTNNKKYNVAIDNPFKVELYSQIIIPISKNNQNTGIIRLSQLPKSFSHNDYRNLCMLLPAFQRVFSHTKHHIYDAKSEYTAKIDVNVSILELDSAFEKLSEYSNNPEIQKLISAGRKNMDALQHYLEASNDSKNSIQEKLKRLNAKRNQSSIEEKKIYANVLIADDVRINVKILNAMLRDDAIIDQIKYAYDGIETMDMINKCKEAKETIHILFLDHHMPGKTGLEVASELKEAVGVDGKIIIVSITNDPDVIASKGHLYDYHIPKPFNKESIQKTMEKIRIEHLS